MQFKKLVTAIVLVTVSSVSADTVNSFTAAIWADASTSNQCKTAPDSVVALRESQLGMSCSGAMNIYPSTCQTDPTNPNGEGVLYSCTSSDSSSFSVPAQTDNSGSYLSIGFTNGTSSTCKMSATTVILGVKMDTCIYNSLYINSAQKTITVYSGQGCQSGNALSTDSWANIFPTCQLLDTSCNSNNCAIRLQIASLALDWAPVPYVVGVDTQRGNPAAYTSDAADIKTASVTALALGAFSLFAQLFA